MKNMKQLRINQSFRIKLLRDCEEIQEELEEIKELEQRLREKQNDLLQLQMDSYRYKTNISKAKPSKFIRPQGIVLQNSIERLKKNIELMAMLSGIEVRSYVSGDHCCIVYHMQHDMKQDVQQDVQHDVKHGLRINLTDGKKEPSKVCLPLGFNFDAVMEEFDNIMSPKCLGAVRKALVAYYDRLQQFEELKLMVNINAQMFKTMDGSHVEISFDVLRQTDEEDDQTKVVLVLDYGVYDIRPKNYYFKEFDLPEGLSKVLKEQCADFKRKPMKDAFKKAFIKRSCAYKLVQQVLNREEERSPRRRHKQFRPNKENYNNDDTFRPEAFTDDSDDE